MLPDVARSPGTSTGSEIVFGAAGISRSDRALWVVYQQTPSAEAGVTLVTTA